MTRILVAGVGNIFCGDDAFGVEVVRLLLRRQAFSSAVDVRDFGVKGIDLAYALTDGYDIAIIVDAAKRGLSPGAISIIEAEQPAVGEDPPQALFPSLHELDPAKVMSLIAMLGGGCERIYFVVCEPLTLGDEEGRMGLSHVVAAAIEPSVRIVEKLISALLQGKEKLGAA